MWSFLKKLKIEPPYDSAISLLEIYFKDTSLLIELLFRFSRIEPEFKENIIAMLNHLREAQKDRFPVYPVF